MTVGAEILFERICTVEYICQTLSKGYEGLIDRMSLQEGNMHAIKIMSKDETLSLLDRLDVLGILYDGIRAEDWTEGPDITKGSGKQI